MTDELTQSQLFVVELRMLLNGVLNTVIMGSVLFIDRLTQQKGGIHIWHIVRHDRRQ